MTFTYPAVFMPHKNDKGYHVTFPDLQCCEADGPDLEDAVEHAREAAYNWLYLEIEEKTFEFPPPDPCGGYQAGGRGVSETDHGDSEAASG